MSAAFSATSPRTDAELLEAWREGDDHAGSELFGRYFDSLFRFFRSKIDDGIEDLVQQTFLACVRSRKGIRSGDSFRAYLYTAARSKLYNHLKHKSRRPVDINPEVDSLEALGITPTGLIAQSHQSKLLLHALRRLPIQHQLVIELYYFERLRARELATILDVPEGTVRSRLRSALKELRGHVETLTSSPELLRTTMSNLDGWARELQQRRDSDPDAPILGEKPDTE